MVEIGALVYRGETAESVHHAAVAVVNSRGALTHYLGDPFLPTATRSSVKPFQALPLVMSGAADRFGLTPKQLAIACASHNGSDEHRETVLSVLAAAGNSPEQLQCGSHWPMGMQLDHIYPSPEEEDDPLRHNCSGKHSGFLALSRHLGAAVESYLDPASPTQQLVRETIGRYCEYPADRLGVGIDGCSAPVFTMPLLNLAIGFKKLASGEGSSEQERAAAGRIRDAMLAHPLMVSGEKRFDYDLARSFPHNLVCKVGAEAVEGIGLADPPIGIAVKVLDGSARACNPICVEVLRQLGVISRVSDYDLLTKYESPEITNYRKLVTGRIVPAFTLRAV
jgi:L-asparaginase II